MTGPAVALIGDAELGRDHVGEARLADARRAEEQHVVEGLAAGARGLDGDAQVGDHLRLADVLVEAARAQRDLEAEVVVDRAAGDEAVVHGGLVYRPERTRRVRRSRSSKRPSPSSLQGAVDAALGLGPRVAEVHEGGDEVVLRGGGRRRRRRGSLGGGEALHLVLQLEDEALGGLLADPGDAGEAGDVARAQGGDEVRGLDAGEDGEGELGPDAGDGDEPLEEGLLRRGEEAEEGERVLAHVGVGEEGDLVARPRRSGRRC